VGKSKAVGEPPFMLGISVLMALSDAVAACGDGTVYPALDAPATPNACWPRCPRSHGADPARPGCLTWA
jgi:xanthine dehydrogenase large subunit